MPVPAIPRTNVSVPVLLVEDNHGDVLLFGEALENEGRGIALQVAKDVDEGIRLLDRIQGGGERPYPAVILIDLHLPGKDGKEFLRYLSEHSGFRLIPVVMLSSSARQQDIDDCMRLGSWHYRVKPRDWAGYQELITFLRQFWNGTVIAAPGR